MSQTDKPKGATSRKGVAKPPAQDFESRIAELMKARDAAEKQAIERHSEFQTLSRRTGQLEAQLGELDEELKRARENSGRADARAVELAKEAAAVREQLDQSARELAESRGELKKLQENRDGAEQALRERDEALRRYEEAKQDRLRLHEDVKKMRELREAAEHESSALRMRSADLKRQLEQAASLRAQVEAANKAEEEEARKLVHVERELGEANEDRRRLHEDLKRAAERRDEAEKEASAQRIQIADLKKQLDQASGLKAKADAVEREAAALRTQAADLKKLLDQAPALKAKADAGEESARKLNAELKKAQELRDASDKEIAALRNEVAQLKLQAGQAEAKAAEANRYFASLEKELLEAQEAGAETERLREEVARLEETRLEQQGFLDELGQTVMELEHRLSEAEAAKAAPPPPPPAPAAAPAPAPAPVAEPPPSVRPVIVIDPDPPPPPAPAPAAELPLPESILPAIPPMQATPSSSSSSETTLRPAHLFGPNAEDGQPAFVLHELLPPDAMGVLYRASERSTGRQFAVRFLSGQAGETQTQAIEREVEKLIALPHPNILHVQGSGRRKNRLYLAMDLVQAPTLSRAKIHDLRRVVTILRDVAGAIHYAHEEKVFHGDLNPDNIVIAKGEDGEQPLVKDFEIAFLLETLIVPPNPKDARLSLRNPAYLPPEQTKTLGAPADVYGLGATLYGALAGHAPFEGKDAAAIRRKVMFEDPAPLQKVRADVPEALAAVVRRAMVKESGLRYATAQAFADALTKFLDASK